MSKTFTAKFESFVRIVISLLMIYIMGILSVASLLSTTGMQTIAEGEDVDSVVIRIFKAQESVIFYHDDVLVNLIMLVLFGLICFLILPKLKKFSLRSELIFITVWTIVMGAVWVNSSMVKPSFDSAYVADDAMNFAKGDFSAMSEKYLQEYPYQLGYIFLIENLTKIISTNFGEPDTTIYIQVMNAICLALLYDGIIMINHIVFEDERIRHLTVLLLTVSAQPVIFCTFTYGIIPGFAFAVWAIALEILYFRKNKLWMAILSAVCLALGVMIKNNNYITLIAVLVIAFVQMLQRKNFLKDIAYLVISAVLSLNILPVVIANYEKRSNTELGDSIPYISWIAMGMCEGFRAPGWYKGTYTIDKFEELEMNSTAMKAYSQNLLEERLEYFKENPQYRKDFFYRKFTSQWNETSYQSIWNNTVRKQYKDKGKLSQWVCYDGVDKVKAYMDFYAQFVFFGCLIAVIACLKQKNFFAVSMPLVVLGGVMYHMLSEAKSQYALPYFILMIGISAYGICIAYDLFSQKIQHYPRFAKFFPVELPVQDIPALPEIQDSPNAEEAPEIQDSPDTDQ